MGNCGERMDEIAVAWAAFLRKWLDKTSAELKASATGGR